VANAFYDQGRLDIVSANYDWDGAVIKCILLDGTYTYDHTSTILADVQAHRVAGSTDQVLAGAAVGSGGVASADSVSFTGISSGLTVKGLAIYWDAGGGNFYLILYQDTGTGFPLTTTGATVTIDWNSTAVHGTVYTATG